MTMRCATFVKSEVQGVVERRHGERGDLHHVGPVRIDKGMVSNHESRIRAAKVQGVEAPRWRDNEFIAELGA